MLLGITAIWGWTFLIVKDAVSSYPVASFLALRFALATLALTPFAIRGFSWRAFAIGALIGVPVGFGYLFQTFGLTATSAANAGLLTGLFVILTPILDRALYATPIARGTMVVAGAGLLGTGLLTAGGRQGFGWGDVLEILTAVAFALQIVWLGRFTSGRSSMQLALGQMIPATAAFLALMLLTPGALRWPSPWVSGAIVITGALASALAFWVQTFVQQRVPPARTAVILLGEPAFAAAFAVWLGGERLSAVQWSGAVLILLSLLGHELWAGSRSSQTSQ
jgi:drug/metabolite transporter (DMT)-like permease